MGNAPSSRTATTPDAVSRERHIRECYARYKDGHPYEHLFYFAEEDLGFLLTLIDTLRAAEAADAVGQTSDNPT